MGWGLVLGGHLLDYPKDSFLESTIDRFPSEISSFIANL